MVGSTSPRPAARSPPSLVVKKKRITIDRVAEGKSVIRVEESDGVEESLRVGVGELLRPGVTGVRGLVDPRGVTRSRGEQIGGLGVEGLDVPKVQCFRPADAARFPGLAAINRPGERPSGPARPGDLGVDCGDTSEASVGLGWAGESSGEGLRERATPDKVRGSSSEALWFYRFLPGERAATRSSSDADVEAGHDVCGIASGSIGLTMWRSNPASLDFRRSSSCPSR